MPSIKYAIIAAAGVGSRLGLGKTKCLLEINGLPLIAYLLKLLDDVEHVRIVVGYQEQEVIETVLRIRRDVVFVRNPAFTTTSTLTSYWLGAQGIHENCLFMDADIIFSPASFMQFKNFCALNPLDNILGITTAKTNDAVFVSRQDNKVTAFMRGRKQEYEWANICWINPSLLAKSGDSVYQQLMPVLPLTASEITSYEIDTKGDMEIAIQSSIVSEYSV